MKKCFIISLLFLLSSGIFAQYIGIKARYTDTRLVENPPYPPSRENRLILSFFTVDLNRAYTPTALTNYPIYIYREGLQYGSEMGGVLDSTGNNYPGYPVTAPRVVAAYSSYGSGYLDCSPVEVIIANGHELDCGFIRVSHWEEDNGTGIPFENFTAPNICLPYYFPPHPYAALNANFNWPIQPGPPYNWYSFSCGNSPQQLGIRGVLLWDCRPGGLNNTNWCLTLPVKFANEKLADDAHGNNIISWSNLTETDVKQYEVERSTGSHFVSIGKIIPKNNAGDKADYSFTDSSVMGREFFYRIKAEELDGKIIYSAVIRGKKISDKSKLNIYPNPVNGDKFVINPYAAKKGRYTVELYNATGNRVLTKSIYYNESPVTVDAQNLPNGIYRLVFRNEQNFLSGTVLVNK